MKWMRCVRMGKRLDMEEAAFLGSIHTYPLRHTIKWMRVVWMEKRTWFVESAMAMMMVDMRGGGARGRTSTPLRRRRIHTHAHARAQTKAPRCTTTAYCRTLQHTATHCMLLRR